MDVAVKFEVQESPLSLVSEVKTKVPVFTKHIIRIDSSDYTPEHEYIQEKIYFTSSSVREAIDEIKVDGMSHDAVLVNPANLSTDIYGLKELARQKAIPFILYTPKFDQNTKDLAFKIGADEYHYGAITYAFLKRIEFIKKLKNYKNQRGNKPYTVVHSMDDVPKIKLWALKRTFDIMVSFTGLLLISPLLILIAILIKLESKGPIFYISKRAGAGYKIFDFYKFRSMRVGADAELKKLEHMNQYGENSANGVFFKIKNDPRVTRIGTILRNTSLDEIPQLINVLKGDMSLVGNRPLPLYEAEKLTKDQIAWRFLAPAGITGLWQVTKRGKEDMSPEERIALDMEYAMKNSFWLDIKILFSTFPALLQKEKV
jgi:lipopolysaccharide/colanic/teichoic acid biosynthesis glycosyltransferase